MRKLSMVGLVSMVAACGSSAPDVVVAVDRGQRFQTMNGFGATLTAFEDDGRFRGDDPTQPAMTSATDAQKQAIGDALYGQLGLTRTRLFPMGVEPQNDNDDPFLLDTSRLDYKLVDPMADWAAMGRDRGLVTFFADYGANGGTEAEAWFRLPGDACALDPAYLDEYVEWHLAVAMRFAERGVELPYVSIGNEIDFCPIAGNPSRSFVDPANYVELVKRLGARLRAHGLATKIVLAEGVTPGSALPYMRAALEDPEARGYLGAIAFHSYDGYQERATLEASAAGTPNNADVRAEIRDLGRQYDLPVWMTEVCYCAPQRDSEGGPLVSDLELGRLRLNHVLDELTLTEVAAFDVMNLDNVSRPGIRDELVEVAFNPDGSLASFAIAMYGYLIGHYAIAAPDGAVRVAADADDPNLRAVAFDRPDGSLAIVLLDNGDDAADVSITIAGGDVASLVPLTTVEGAPWTEGAAIAVADGAARITVPARSVTTLTSR